MYKVLTATERKKKLKIDIALKHFKKASSIDLKNQKVDNLFQHFVKMASEIIIFIFLGDKCLREIFNYFCELLQASVSLTIIVLVL